MVILYALFCIGILWLIGSFFPLKGHYVKGPDGKILDYSPDEAEELYNSHK